MTAADGQALEALALAEVLRHPPRTPGRRAAASAWVALITTPTPAAALRALAGFTAVDTGRAAAELLGRLADKASP